MKKSYIAGTGSYVPERVMTNFDLEKMVETSDEWITTRSGIRARRIAAPGEATSDLAIQAGRRALEKSGTAAGDLDLILVATYTPDRLMPSTACYVQHALGAQKAAAFDLSAACTGFIYALSVGDQFIRTGMYRTVLVIGAEVCSRFLDFTDRTTCVLFGDGAGAVVLKAAPENDKSPRGILSTYIRADGWGAEKLGIGAGGSREPLTAEVLEKRRQFIFMSGQDIFKFSMKVIEDALTEGIKPSGLGLEQIDVIIPHQANIRIIDSAFSRLNIPREKAFVNLDKYGNTSAASIPLALDEAFDQGRVRAGNTLAMVGFGAGFTWGTAVVRL